MENEELKDSEKYTASLLPFGPVGNSVAIFSILTPLLMLFMFITETYFSEYKDGAIGVFFIVVMVAIFQCH